MTMRKSTQQIMIDWMRNFLVDYPIPSLVPFPQSMQDGKVLCYLVHKTDPNAIDISNVDSRSALENIKIAFTAGSKLGIPPLLDAEDVIQAPDNHSILTYLSFYRQKAKGDGMIGKSPAPVAAAATPSTTSGPAPTGAKPKANFAYGGAIKAPPKTFAGGGIKAIAKVPASLEVPKAEPVKSPIHPSSTSTVTETSEVRLSVASTATETTKVVETVHHKEEISVKTEASEGNKSPTSSVTPKAIVAPSPASPAASTAPPKAAPASSVASTAPPKAAPAPAPSSHKASFTSAPSSASSFTSSSASSSASSTSSPVTNKIKGLSGKFESPASSPTTTKLRITTNASSTLSSKTSVSSTSPHSPTSPTSKKPGTGTATATTSSTSYKSTTTTTSKTTSHSVKK